MFFRKRATVDAVQEQWQIQCIRRSSPISNPRAAISGSYERPG